MNLPLKASWSYTLSMSSLPYKILSPKGRPSRPLSEIRAVIRKVAAEAAKKENSVPATGSKEAKPPARTKAAKTVKKPLQD